MPVSKRFLAAQSVRPATWMVGSLIVLSAVLGALVVTSPDPSRSPIQIACAASNRGVIEAVCDRYQRLGRGDVSVQYGASQSLLSSLIVSGVGDLFLPADDDYLKLAGDRDLILDVFPVARMYVIVAVAKGNPRSITSFGDLLRDDVRLVQASDETAAVGKLTRQALSPTGLNGSLDAATNVVRPSVTEVANDLVVGAADVGIIYDAMLSTYPQLEMVRMPEFESATATVSIGLLRGSTQRERAMDFVNFLLDSDGGLAVYREFGFEVAQ